jgi:origin recognition complex subunit 1
VGRFGVD